MTRLARLSACLITALALSASMVLAHPATERYIPIGKSSGESQIGTIEAVNVEDQSIRVGGQEALHWVRLTDRTHIWLDRTKISKSNLLGGISDCQTGRLVEIRYEDEDRAVAAWIKIAVPLSGL